MMYGSWDIRHKTKFFVILDYFLPFYPTNNLENKNFEKMKNVPKDIIILHMRTINENQIMYGSWDMEHDRHNFFSLRTILCPFTLLTTQKIKILKKWKKSLEISSFHTSVPQMKIIGCMIPEIWSTTNILFSHFEPFFAFTPLTTQKIKILKKWKKKTPWDIITLHKCTKKSWLYARVFPTGGRGMGQESPPTSWKFCSSLPPPHKIFVPPPSPH